jgi:outer membrane protein OmpA-like peptidoglycan-associated protein
MHVIRSRSSVTLAFSVLGAAIALYASGQLAQAEDPTLADEILKALTPQSTTRSLSTTPEQSNFVETLKKKTAGSVAPDEREKLATLAKNKPSIDIDIGFDFNSDKIGPAAAQAVKEVAAALSNPQLTGNTFVIAGHTDGKGADLYNQNLSERRAEAVKRYLVEIYKIPARNLVAVGYGKTMLKNSGDPFAPENRRVQVVNMTDKDVANKR